MQFRDVVFLLPGEWYFGDTARVVKTVLGSCVAVIMWHPELGIGGMSHIVLPQAPSVAANESPGRFADSAIDILSEQSANWKTDTKDYRVGLYGGGHGCDIDTQSAMNSIGAKNVRATEKALARRNFTIREQHVGGMLYRNIRFHLPSGRVELVETPFNRP